MAELNHWPWREWARRTPFAVALTAEGRSWCWKDLLQQIDSLAAGFIQQGVVEGSGVVLRSKNSLEALLAYLALIQTGARLLPLNPQLPVSLCSELIPQLDIDFILDFGDPPLASEPSTLALATLSLRHAHHAKTPKWLPQRLATLTLTSGSSGLPKAAAHSVAAHIASAQGVLGLIPFAPTHRWLLSLPLFHVSGQGIIWRWLTVGAQLRVAENLPLAEALQGCTHASLVPTQLWRLLNQQQLPVSLQDVLLGGAHIAQELTERAERAGIRCWCGYGMTETASTVTAKRADGTSGVGYKLVGKEVMLVDGEVFIRTPSLAAGYWQHGALTPLTDAEGWFHTRDCGEWVGDEMYIAGRLDNLFICGGENVQPEAIESIFLQHPEIHQVFILPMSDAEYGQRPVAIIEAAKSLDFSTLHNWTQGKLARFQQPAHYFSLPESLSNGGIKISRKDLATWVSSL